MTMTFEQRLAASDFSASSELKDSLRNKLFGGSKKTKNNVIRFRTLSDGDLDMVAAAGEDTNEVIRRDL